MSLCYGYVYSHQDRSTLITWVSKVPDEMSSISETSSAHHCLNVPTERSVLLKITLKYIHSHTQGHCLVPLCSTGQIVEFLREIGGVTFIYNLSRASDYSEVKETALFSLSSLAEVDGVYVEFYSDGNVTWSHWLTLTNPELHIWSLESCKQSLCREEMFCSLADCIEQDDSLTLKRVAVYMLSVLVSNNSKLCF